MSAADRLKTLAVYAQELTGGENPASFLRDHGLELLFGLATVVLSVIALRYRRREHIATVHKTVGNRAVSLFLERTPMIEYLKTMYDAARPGETIWGQCVGCQNYGFDVRAKTLEAASRGVRINFIVNTYAPTRQEFKELYAPIRTAVLKEADNQISIQGLGEREVVFSSRGVTSYTGILIRDPTIVKVLREWFSDRFAQLPHLDAEDASP